MYIAKTFRRRGVKFAPISFLKNINQLPFISPIRFLMGSLNQQENPPAIPYISAKPSRHLPFIYAIKVVASNLKELLNPPAIPYTSVKSSRHLPFISPIRFLTDSLNQQVNPPAIPYISVKSSRHLPFIYAIKVLASNINQQTNHPAIPYFGKTIETLTFHICNQGSGEQHCEPAGTKTMLFRFSVPLRGSHSESVLRVEL